jgi:hypothetical protein
MTRLKWLIFAILLLCAPAYADLSPLEITEEDGAPSTFPYKVKFSNGTVTDNGDGTTSVSSGSGSGITIGGTITGGTDTRVLFDDAGAIGEDAGFLFGKTTDQLTLGENGQDGSLKLYAEDGATDHSTIIQPGTQTTDITYTLPTYIVSGNILTIESDGSLYWQTDDGGTGSGTPGGNNTNIQYNNSGSFGGSDEFVYNGTSQVTLSGYVLLTEEPTPSTPSSGFGSLYSKGDGKPYFKNDAGTDYDLTKQPTREFSWVASALEPLEAADSIPPISKFTGTNVDILTCSFDDTTDEGRKTTIRVPTEINTSGTVTFGIVWFSRTATTGNAVWDMRYQQTGTSGESWDQALITKPFAPSAVQGTTNQMSIATTNVTVSTLGWAPGDMIDLMWLRDANNGLDTLVGDAEVRNVYVLVPLT